MPFISYKFQIWFKHPPSAFLRANLIDNHIRATSGQLAPSIAPSVWQHMLLICSDVWLTHGQYLSIFRSFAPRPLPSDAAFVIELVVVTLLIRFIIIWMFPNGGPNMNQPLINWRVNSDIGSLCTPFRSLIGWMSLIPFKSAQQSACWENVYLNEISNNTALDIPFAQRCENHGF